MRPPFGRRPSIGAVLLGMTVAALVLPLSGLWILRLYESALIRQTESELIAQAGVVAAFYRDAWRRAGGKPEALGPPVDPAWTRPPGFDPPWTPRFASLDLAEDPVLPPAPDPVPAMATEFAAAIAGSTLAPILREAQRTTLAGMRVTDHQGVVVASTGEEMGLSLARQEEVRRALAGEAASVLRERMGHERTGQERTAQDRTAQDRMGYGAGRDSQTVPDRSRSVRVFTAQPVLDAGRVVGVVVLSRTPRSLADTLYGKRWPLAGLALLLLLSVGVLARLGTVAIARPLRAVTALAKRTADGERGVMVPLPRPVVREVAELSDALARMARTLEERADYIRDFAAHVSHEFKTPLTTIRGTVELLRDHLDSMPPADRDRFLANMDAEAERLSRLVRRLLELARADVMTVTDDAATDAVPVAARLADRHGADASLPASLPVAMEREALESVLANLIENARNHAGAAARVTVTLKAEGERAILQVADDGPGISPANADLVFVPFFTTARDRSGTGLGLTIARGLVEAHGGSIALLPSDRGALFEVTLRRVRR
ncbi:sensor histidine kinase [Azospirillum picis]|uniref:histidine kinase n=1 Tax=Azospirillum picis TaxID=488438 RepID=A0ABU0MMQ9_9PROT|nr:HAMP domain-containing sensor histidine kinase [Azospirillum picis]MBP2300793.1 signal transduction histidine kinase [Azospirillum picis]MDQ0534762.1 signal transduction histidine kinase [Azospirillum picis]